MYLPSDTVISSDGLNLADALTHLHRSLTLRTDVMSFAAEELPK